MGLEMKYFVLKPRSKRLGDAYARASREALRAYAKSVADSDLELAEALWDWAREEAKYENDRFR